MRITIEDEIRQRMTTDYAMEHLWLLTNAVYAIGGGELKTPSYISIVHPNAAASDTRSAEQIKQDILKKLTS